MKFLGVEIKSPSSIPHAPPITPNKNLMVHPIRCGLGVCLGQVRTLLLLLVCVSIMGEGLWLPALPTNMTSHSNCNHYLTTFWCESHVCGQFMYCKEEEYDNQNTFTLWIIISMIMHVWVAHYYTIMLLNVLNIHVFFQRYTWMRYMFIVYIVWPR